MTHTSRSNSGIDPYLTDVHAWWHLSRPSPELLRALDRRWLPSSGQALDLGCGLGTESGFLAQAGFTMTGVDISAVALSRARQLHSLVRFVRADAMQLPFADAAFDVLLDRGCFHYLVATERRRYAEEAWRVLRPRGRLLLRACLRAAGVRNDISKATLRHAFERWRFVALEQDDIVSDTRTMSALIALLEREA